MNLIIKDIVLEDLRFPTSKHLDGSDAMNPDPDYSAAYVKLITNDERLTGHGLTFTLGRGNEICLSAINAFKHHFINKNLNDITDNFGEFWFSVTRDSQLRWLGPDKGVMHLSLAALINAVWDLWAKSLNVPVWRLVSDLSAEKLINCLDFSYISDVVTPKQALEIVKRNKDEQATRISTILQNGYPAYTTSPGWLGYSDEKLRYLCQQARDQGWQAVKLKVGQNIADDIRRCRIARETIGSDIKLMIDANQVWDTDTAIDWVNELSDLDIYWIEEPTSPDDVLAHKKIKDSTRVAVATGEQCQNRIMFKQFMQANAIDFCQIDSCRLGGLNEVLAVLLMAAKFNIPVCPHAGGVGLCEYVQHISIIDYLCFSGKLENRMIEYVDHLHEHFVDPVKMSNGHYLAPNQPGFSIAIKDKSIAQYRFPNGFEWAAVNNGK